VVRTVVDHPRRLGELVGLLEDADVVTRGRAAATLARLADSHPERLMRVTDRIRCGLTDDSAFVRWHLAYALGRLAVRFPKRSDSLLPELVARLEDDNRVVRAVVHTALTEFAGHSAELLENWRNSGSNIPTTPLARILQYAGRPSQSPRKPRK